MVVENLQNHFIFKILIFDFIFWSNFATEKMATHYDDPMIPLVIPNMPTT